MDEGHANMICEITPEGKDVQAQEIVGKMRKVCHISLVEVWLIKI